jgi:membrane protein
MKHYTSIALMLFKATCAKWNADNCLRLGASLSYYTLFSLFPCILIALSITRIALISSDAARDAILNGLATVTGGFRDEFLYALRATEQRQATVGVIGGILLLLGAAWVFGELVSAFNIIWQVQPPAGGGPLEFMRVTLFSFALVLSGTFLLLVSLIINAALTTLATLLYTLPGGVALWGGLQTVINLGLLTVVFALLLKYLPQTNVEWRDVWLGAVLTALLWTLLQALIGYYIAFSDYDAYGAIGAILALVAWVYLSSQVLFLGGEFTAVWSQHYGSRAPQSSLV